MADTKLAQSGTIVQVQRLRRAAASEQTCKVNHRAVYLETWRSHAEHGNERSAAPAWGQDPGLKPPTPAPWILSVAAQYPASADGLLQVKNRQTS